MEKWWNEICGRGKREKPLEIPTQTPFRPPRNPQGVTETRTRDPSGGRRASNRLRHEAASQLNVYSPLCLVGTCGHEQSLGQLWAVASWIEDGTHCIEG